MFVYYRFKNYLCHKRKAMKNYNTLLFLLFLFVGVTSKLSAQQGNGYSKCEFKFEYRVMQPEADYAFSVVFCKSTVNRFPSTSDTDKVLLLTIVKSVARKEVGKYEANYKIVSSVQDSLSKSSFDFTAVLNKVTKSEVTGPEVLNLNKLTMNMSYDMSYFLKVFDKQGKFFDSAVEVTEDDGWGW